MVWVPELVNKNCAALASFNASFYFLVCLVLIFIVENPLLAMAGTFASILTCSPGWLSPYLLPWDLPTLAAWTIIFAIYTKLRIKTADRYNIEWILLTFIILLLGLLKETVLVTALFLVAAPWNWPKRLVVILITVAGSQLLNYLLTGASPDWAFSADQSIIPGAGRWQPLSIWPVIFANCGTVVLMPWMLLRQKEKNWPLCAVCGTFILCQLLNNLACGAYSENRDWLELAPIGWILVGADASPRSSSGLCATRSRSVGA